MSIKIRINQVEFRNNCNFNPSIDRGESQEVKLYAQKRL
jgi:hypothetical protein